MVSTMVNSPPLPFAASSVLRSPFLLLLELISCLLLLLLLLLLFNFLFANICVNCDLVMFFIYAGKW